MKREDFLKLEEAPIEELEEYAADALAVLQEYKSSGGKQKAKEVEEDIERVKCNSQDKL